MAFAFKTAARKFRCMEVSSGKKNRITLYIGIALVAGIIAGFIFNKTFVGSENTRIANADIQLEHLQHQMHAFEKIKDSSVFNLLTAQQKLLEAEKSKAVNTLLEDSSEVAALTKIKVLNDSLKAVNTRLIALTDTPQSAYKTLQQQHSLVQAQKSGSLKSRDKKLEWFTILADIFLRLIKMIVAPLVFTTLVVGVAKLGDIKAVGRIGGNDTYCRKCLCIQLCNHG